MLVLLCGLLLAACAPSAPQPAICAKLTIDTLDQRRFRRRQCSDLSGGAPVMVNGIAQNPRKFLLDD